MGVEGRHIGIGILAAGERGARDVELVVLDRVHDAHARVGGVAGEKDHLDARLRRQERVEPEQLPHQRESDARSENLVLVLELVPVVGLHALFLEYAVRLLQVEQRPGRDGDHQLTVEGCGHWNLERVKGIEPSS